MRKTRAKFASLQVRALRTKQGENVNVYAFFMPGAEITRIADISRVERDVTDALKGFQRREIKDHVKSIVEFLDQGAVLFPNAITLALSPEVKFSLSRGPAPEGADKTSQAGVLSIPIREEGERVAWIVDGQQRSLALAQAKNSKFPVPVIAFVSDDIQVQREQFILVNKAKPLPTRLINELLPETGGIVLPRDLGARKIPSELCNLLHRDPHSPFYKLIKRLSDKESEEAVIIDTAIVNMIRNSLNNPLGALATYRAANSGPSDIQGMYQLLSEFWGAVKDTFPDAWGKPPTQSRLMHSAGIQAMGVLMDRIYARHGGTANEIKAVRADLERIAPDCCWTKGTWDGLNLAWNEVQNTTKHIKQLADALVRLQGAKGVR
jgi:DGQHR domain-containing protein